MKIDLHDALTALDLNFESITDELAQIPDGPGDWSKRTKLWRRIIQRARKKMMKKAHPDKAGDGSEALERAQYINQMADLLLKTDIVPRPEPQLRVQIHVSPFDNIGTGTSAGPRTKDWGDMHSRDLEIILQAFNRVKWKS